MNFTASSYTGARAVTFTASSSSSIIKAGSQATLEAVAVHVGLKGDTGEKGDDGVSAFVSGAGIVIVGTEIRLSIGTLPQVG